MRVAKNSVDPIVRNVHPIKVFVCPFDVSESAFPTSAARSGNMQSYGLNAPLNEAGEFLIAPAALYPNLKPHCVSVKPGKLFDYPYTGSRRAPATVVYIHDKHTQRWLNAGARPTQQAGKFGWFVDFNAYDFGGQVPGYEFDCGHPIGKGSRLVMGPARQGLPNALFYDLHVERIRAYPGPNSPEELKKFTYVAKYGGPTDAYYGYGN